MAKNESDKQRIVHMTQHRKLQNYKQQEPNQKLGVISSAVEE